ncbi:MAG TPA: hypothetical protein VMU05_09240 [Dongiaceae bacterium]|nr:hypothetical protein [Dongiaceae bacterium]
MEDQKVYRRTGACGLAAIAAFFVEFPFYLVRAGFPGVTDPGKISDFTATYGTNVMICVFFDFIILTLFMIFLAGFRHLIRQADKQYEWLGTLIFGVGLVYVTLTLVADSLQAATVVDARTIPGNGVIIRAMLESTFLMYGSVALFLMAVFMALAGYAGAASRALPAWSAWVGYLCALCCLVFVPSMFVGSPDIMHFYNPAGWGPEAIASGFPLAAWMITIGILMVRMRQPVVRSASVAA